MTIFTKTETITTIDYLAVARVAANAELAVADPKELDSDTKYVSYFDECTFEQQSACVEIVEQICNIVYMHRKDTELFYECCVNISNSIWIKRGWKYGEKFNTIHKIDNTLIPYHEFSDNQKLQTQVFADTVWNIVRSLPLDVFPHLKK